jgi:hypothetical protein
MPRQHDHLFNRIASFQALREAARRAVRGKRKKPGVAAFFANLEGAGGHALDSDETRTNACGTARSRPCRPGARTAASKLCSAVGGVLLNLR